MNDRHRRRLLQRLQQRVLRSGSQRVGAVDDDDAALALERAVRGAVDDIADLLDLDRPAGSVVARLENENVRMDAAGDARARGAGATCVERQRVLRFRPCRVPAFRVPGSSRLRVPSSCVRLEAIERLRDGRRGQALADAGRPGEDQARRQRVARDRARQQLDDTPMADDVSKRHVRGQVCDHPETRPHGSYHASLLVVLPSAQDARPEPSLLDGCLGRQAGCDRRPAVLGDRRDAPTCCRAVCRTRRRPRGDGLPRREAEAASRRKGRRASRRFHARNAARSTPSARCRGQSIRCKPSTAFSASPFLSTTSTCSQPSAASLPVIRQTVAVDTPRGALNHSGSSFCVAAFMNAAQRGTATSEAYPFGRIVRGWSKPTHTPVTSFGV